MSLKGYDVNEYINDMVICGKQSYRLDSSHYPVEVSTAFIVTVKVTPLDGRAMAQAVSRRYLTAEAGVRSQVGPCGICRGQSGTGTSFTPRTSVFSLSISFHRCSIKMQKQKKPHHLPHRVGCTIVLQVCGTSVASAAGPSIQ
jgi:hypothetical protein